MRKLTDAELNTIANCARTAMERFEANAKELRDACTDELPDGQKETYKRLAEQFDRQAGEARALAWLFDQMPPAAIGTCGACMEADPAHTSRDCPDRRLLALINQ